MYAITRDACKNHVRGKSTSIVNISFFRAVCGLESTAAIVYVFHSKCNRSCVIQRLGNTSRRGLAIAVLNGIFRAGYFHNGTIKDGIHELIPVFRVF